MLSAVSTFSWTSLLPAICENGKAHISFVPCSSVGEPEEESTSSGVASSVKYNGEIASEAHTFRVDEDGGFGDRSEGELVLFSVEASRHL